MNAHQRRKLRRRLGRTAESGSLHPICSAFLRGYCIFAFILVHVIHFPVFALYWLGHLAEWIMENVTCQAGQHIVNVWRSAGRPNDQTETQP